MLVLARKPGESLVIGDGIEIKIIDVTVKRCGSAFWRREM